MKSFNHFILTRFNVKVAYSKSGTGLDPEWLKHRFKLFDQFCYPSVRAQLNQNFKWIVFFDSQTPQAFKDKVKEYSKWQNFIPVYVDGEFTNQINQSTLMNHLTSGVEYLITTRLDNDDAVCKDFVQIVQNNFHEQDSEFINLAYGYVWKDGKLYSFKYLNNPFMSLIEKINKLKAEEFKTILCKEHTQLSSIGQIQQIKTQPAWLQVVHEKNVSNRIRGIRQPIKKLGDRFAISVEDVPRQEKPLLYWMDKGLSILKFPLESIVLSLPKDTRARLREFSMSLQK